MYGALYLRVPPRQEKNRIISAQAARLIVNCKPDPRSPPRASKKRTPALLKTRGFSRDSPVTTYFRTLWHYHRRERLNFCVRHGNRCCPLAVVTGNSIDQKSDSISNKYTTSHRVVVKRDSGEDRPFRGSNPQTLVRSKLASLHPRRNRPVAWHSSDQRRRLPAVTRASTAGPPLPAAPSRWASAHRRGVSCASGASVRGSPAGPWRR